MSLFYCFFGANRALARWNNISFDCFILIWMLSRGISNIYSIACDQRVINNSFSGPPVCIRNAHGAKARCSDVMSIRLAFQVGRSQAAITASQAAMGKIYIKLPVEWERWKVLTKRCIPQVRVFKVRVRVLRNPNLRVCKAFAPRWYFPSVSLKIVTLLLWIQRSNLLFAFDAFFSSANSFGFCYEGTFFRRKRCGLWPMRPTSPPFRLLRPWTSRRRPLLKSHSAFGHGGQRICSHCIFQTRFDPKGLFSAVKNFN